MKVANTKPSETNIPKKTEVDIKTVATKQLEEFVTTNANDFFSILGLS